MSGFKELLAMFSGMMKPRRSVQTAKKKSEYKYKASGGMNLNQRQKRQKRKRWASNPHLRP